MELAQKIPRAICGSTILWQSFVLTGNYFRSTMKAILCLVMFALLVCGGVVGNSVPAIKKLLVDDVGEKTGKRKCFSWINSLSIPHIFWSNSDFSRTKRTRETSWNTLLGLYYMEKWSMMRGAFWLVPWAVRILQYEFCLVIITHWTKENWKTTSFSFSPLPWENNCVTVSEQCFYRLVDRYNTSFVSH